MPDSANPPPGGRPSHHVVAFDFGLHRIGVAVGNELLGSATALPALAARDGVPDWQSIAKLLLAWQPRCLLVGLPLNMDGSPSDMSARAERFARRLHGRYQLPCEMMDERLTSREARSQMALGRRANDSRETGVDSEAASLILEAWFAARDTR
jgi:putative holliday junction resolvase